MSTGEVCWDLIGSCNKCLLRPQLGRVTSLTALFFAYHTRYSSMKNCNSAAQLCSPSFHRLFNSSSHDSPLQNPGYLRTSVLSAVCPLCAHKMSPGGRSDIPRVFAIPLLILIFGPGLGNANMHTPMLVTNLLLCSAAQVLPCFLSTPSLASTREPLASALGHRWRQRRACATLKAGGIGQSGLGRLLLIHVWAVLGFRDV